jgi:hypothetical protein
VCVCLSNGRFLFQFNHKHVVRLIGVVTLGDPIMVCASILCCGVLNLILTLTHAMAQVLLEYCEFGSLDKYLKANALDGNVKVC